MVYFEDDSCILREFLRKPHQKISNRMISTKIECLRLRMRRYNKISNKIAD